jgi:hypothetical protein
MSFALFELLNLWLVDTFFMSFALFELLNLWWVDTSTRLLFDGALVAWALTAWLPRKGQLGAIK